MNCEKCGGYIRREDTYCPHCGAELIKSEFKPLQKKFMRGEYQNKEEKFYDDYIEQQFIEEEPSYREPKPRKKYRGYDLDAYYGEEEEAESSDSGLVPIILILFIALLIGFIFGMFMFANSLRSTI